MKRLFVVLGMIGYLIKVEQTPQQPGFGFGAELQRMMVLCTYQLENGRTIIVTRFPPCPPKMEFDERT